MRIDDELHRIAGQVEVHARALFLDDPALGLGRALGPEDFPHRGVLAPRPAHLSESITPTIPVLLFEPGETLALRDTRTGLLTEMQTEMIIAAGLVTEGGAGPAAATPPAGITPADPPPCKSLSTLISGTPLVTL